MIGLCCWIQVFIGTIQKGLVISRVLMILTLLKLLIELFGNDINWIREFMWRLW